MDNYYMNWYEEEKEEQLSRLPKCCLCGEPIQQEDAVCIDDHWYCDECLKGAREEIWLD